MPEAPPAFDPPALLTEAHDSTTFTSGEPVLDEWLQRRALNNLRTAASRTYVVCPASPAETPDLWLPV